MSTTTITVTEKRVLQNLHLRGFMGKMGSMTQPQRLALLNSLISRGLLDKHGNVTQLGIDLSI